MNNTPRTLDEIGVAHGTDKSSTGHDYLKLYEKLWSHLRNEHNILLELGYGGIKRVDAGGQSMRTWLEYFPNSSIYAIDIYPKDYESTPRSACFECDQTDRIGLNKIIDNIGTPNIIIDDASHISDKTVTSFEILFPLLASGGYYVVEDMQTSYDSGLPYKGGLRNHNSSMNRLKQLLDTMYYEYNCLSDAGVYSVFFFHKIIFIQKK